MQVDNHFDLFVMDREITNNSNIGTMRAPGKVTTMRARSRLGF
jgi:hypothetical protein